MFASIRKSRIDPSQVDVATAKLEEEIISRLQQLLGAVAGYGLEPVYGMGMSIVIFETKDDAERPFHNAQPGESPLAGGNSKSWDVRQVAGRF